MAIRSAHSEINSDQLPKTSILGIIFFLIGAPTLYSLLRRQPQSQEHFTFPRIITIALFAGAIASAIEISVLH
ncbi:hypothetical protein C7271_08905 [filamentous cyanobacterium CCP5]|nr:hypothetical protein C7271_08905 [filamentous cyanobacterium CCP5]